MTSKVSVFFALSLAGGMAAFAPVHTAAAQGSFAGTWTVTELTRPDWIEPTSPEPNTPLKIGDQVTFEENAIRAIDPYGCENPKYESKTVSPLALFDGGIGNEAKAASVALAFGLSNNAPTLRVDCENYSYEYHEGRKGLVMHFDNMVYTFKRAAAAR